MCLGAEELKQWYGDRRDFLANLSTLATCASRSPRFSPYSPEIRKKSCLFCRLLKSRTEQGKCSYLLIWVGQKGRDIYNTWSDISDDDRKKFETYYERFENHVSPKANPVFARFKFHSRVQESSETAEKFITALRILAQDCDFKDPEE